MSLESMAIAMNHSRATGTARLVLMGIASHNGDGGAWPAIASLKRYAGGVDKRNIQRAIEKLEELGEIRRLVQAGGTAETRDDRRPNRYLFLLKCPSYCDGSSQHRDRRKPLVTLVFEDETDGVATAPSGGDSAGGGVATAPPELSLEPINRLNKESLVLNRASEKPKTSCLKSPSLQHIFDASSGWCNFCEAREDKVA